MNNLNYIKFRKNKKENYSNPYILEYYEYNENNLFKITKKEYKQKKNFINKYDCKFTYPKKFIPFTFNNIFKYFNKYTIKKNINKNYFIIIKDFNIKNLNFNEFVCFNLNENNYPELPYGFFKWDSIIDIKNKILYKYEEFDTRYNCEECPKEILIGYKIDKILKPTNFKDKNNNIIFEDDICFWNNNIYKVKFINNEYYLIDINNKFENKILLKNNFQDKIFYRTIETNKL